MARKRAPLKGMTSMVAPNPPPVEGIDNLPIPSGVNMTAVKWAEENAKNTPMGGENNGDNPSIPDVASFGNGKDGRSFTGAGSSNSNPNAGKAGA